MAKVADLHADITANTSGLESGLRGSSKKLKTFADKLRGIALPLLAAKAGTDLLEKGLSFVKKSTIEAFKTTQKYTFQVRDLSNLIGASSDEASRFIQIADGLQISYSQLESGLSQAIKKGYEPTISGLKEMADEYNALPTAIERSKFALDTFGRTGENLIPMLKLGSEGIGKYSSEIEDYLVLTSKQVENNIELARSIDTLNSAWEGFQIQAATGLAPTISGFVDRTMGQDIFSSVTNMIDAIMVGGNPRDLILTIADAINTQNDENEDSIDTNNELNEVRKEGAVTLGDYAGLLGKTTDALDSQNMSIGNMVSEQVHANLAREIFLQDMVLQIGLTGEIAQAQNKFNEEMEDAGRNTDKQAMAIDNLNESYEDFILSTLGGLGADTETQMSVAVAFGEIDNKSIAIFGAIQAIQEMGLSASQTAEMLVDVRDRVSDLDNVELRDKSMTIQINYLINGTMVSGFGIGMGGSISNLIGGGGSSSGKKFIPGGVTIPTRHGGSFIGLQHGGRIVPPGFSNDGMMVGVSSGERLDVTPAGNSNVVSDDMLSMLEDLQFTMQALPGAIKEAVRT